MLNVLRRRRGTMLVVMVIVTGAALGVGTLLTPRYTATATIMIETRPSRIVNVEQMQPSLPDSQETLDTEINLITSRPLAARIMDELNLFQPEPPRFAKLADMLAPSAAAQSNVGWSGRTMSVLAEFANHLRSARSPSDGPNEPEVHA